MTIIKKNNHILSASVLLCLLCSSLSFSAVATQESAPGRGIIPAVSNHYKTMPTLYDFNKMPAEQITSKIKRRFILGTQSMVTQWDLKAGTKLPLHFHVNEQIVRVEKGILEVYSQEQKYVVTPGQYMVFPPNVPHEFIAVKDTIIYEQVTPVRQDFINGEFDKNIAKLRD